MADMKDLNEEQLESVTGGYVHKNGPQWEIINDRTGSVMIKVKTKEIAQSIAKKNKQSPKEISDKQLSISRDK